LSLKGKVAVVTGASRGIGKVISENLAKSGVNLAINSRSPDQLERIKDELKSYGIDVLPCPANLAEAEECVGIIKKTAEYFGGIDILVNNAGIAISKALRETTTDEWDLHMKINARAPFILSREALPYLIKSDMGTIINISSVVGRKGYVN